MLSCQPNGHENQPPGVEIRNGAASEQILIVTGAAGEMLEHVDDVA